MYYGGSTYGRKHKIFFLGLDTFGHNIIVCSNTQSPANNVTLLALLAENSSHVIDITYFSSPLSSLVGHQHLALTQILLTILQSTLMCKSLIHSFMGYVIVMVFLFKETPYGAGEMAQRLRALTALPEFLSSIPSHYMVAHNHL